MRIAYDLTALDLDKGGTARAIEQTLPLLEADPEIELIRLRHRGAAPATRLGQIRRGLARELWYLPRELPRAATRAGAELLHSPSQLGPVKCPIPQVITIYDAIGWDHPEWLTRGNVMQLHHRATKIVAGGANVITSSEYSRAKLQEVFGVGPDRISVVPLGLDSRFSPEPDPGDAARLSALGVDAPFIFTVGTLQPRKNLGAAIDAFERIEHAGELKLVIAGARGWHDDELLRRIGSSPASGRIALLGRVSDDDLIALYRAAACFVFPSRYEGFGFPPLEAMASGTPVLSSRRTSLAEVVGDAAVELDPEDADQIAAAIDLVMSDEAFATRLAKKGLERAATYTWSATARATIDVYRRMLGRGAGPEIS